MEIIKCPRCGKEIDRDRHYYYCVRLFNGTGCNTLWGITPDCYFTGIYLVDEVGQIIAYKQTAQEGGKIIKTDKLLSRYKPRELSAI